MATTTGGRKPAITMTRSDHESLSRLAEGRRLHDILRAGDKLVVRWVDRLGRNYQDVTDTIRAFMRQGVVVKTVINGMTFDGATRDPIPMKPRLL